jgi:hypothetical protein
VGKERKVSKMPKTGGGIGHDIDRARYVVVSSVIPMEALVQGLEAQQIRGGAGGGRRPFALPKHCSGVVMQVVDGLFPHV